MIPKYHNSSASWIMNLQNNRNMVDKYLDQIKVVATDQLFFCIIFTFSNHICISISTV